MRCGGQTGFSKLVSNLSRSYKYAWPFGFHLGSVPFIDKKRNSIKLIKFRLSKPSGLENGRFLNSWLLIAHLCLRVPTHPSTQISGKQLRRPGATSRNSLAPWLVEASDPLSSGLPFPATVACQENRPSCARGIRVGAGALGCIRPCWC